MQFTIRPRQLSGYTFTILHFKLFENYKVQDQFLTILVYSISHNIRGILITLTPPPHPGLMCGAKYAKKSHIFTIFFLSDDLSLQFVQRFPFLPEMIVSLNAYTLFESRIGRG